MGISCRYERTKRDLTEDPGASIRGRPLIHLDVIELVGGFIYLLAGADLLVRGTVGLARRAHIPEVLVALTVVALGTSLPEFIVAIQALLSGYPGILLGNVVGSNIANVLLVGGVTAVIHPVAPGDEEVRRDAAVMVAVTLGFAGMCLVTGLDRTAGLVLVVGLLGVLVLAARDALDSRRDIGERTPIEWVLGVPDTALLIGIYMAAGVVGLPLGSRLVVDAAVDLAADLGVTETVIGLSVVAFSTSLPELATTVVAAWQRRTSLVLGTIVGSNIFNIVAIMGISAAASPTPIPVPGRFRVLDLPVLVATAVVIALFVWTRKSVGRVVGAAMALGYVGYVAALYLAG